MKRLKYVTLLFMMLTLSGCKTYRYLDFHTKEIALSGYRIVPVMESTPTTKPIKIEGASIHESYPITLRFFLLSDIDKKPKRFEVSSIELTSTASGNAIEVTPNSTEKVNRPTKLSHGKDILTMHFVAHRFNQKELPFEDYLLSCRVQIEEHDSIVIEQVMTFEMKSSIVSGFR